MDTWTYQNINSVFHNPAGSVLTISTVRVIFIMCRLELTEKEKIEKAKKEKIILHGNTRLTRTPWKSDKQDDRIRKEVENREAMEAGEETL